MADSAFIAAAMKLQLELQNRAGAGAEADDLEPMEADEIEMSLGCEGEDFDSSDESDYCDTSSNSSGTDGDEFSSSDGSDFEKTGSDRSKPAVTQKIHEKVEGGHTFLKPAFGRIWWQQIDKSRQIKWRVFNDKEVTCNICDKHFPKGPNQSFHEEHTHKGGKICTTCRFVSFNYVTELTHKCVPDTDVYVIENNRAIIDRGRPAYRTYGIPMKRKNKRVTWIGTTSKADPIAAAHSQERHAKRAKKTNFIGKDGKATGCSSYNRMRFNKIKRKRYVALDQIWQCSI